MVPRLTFKPRISQPGDVYEQEADRVAEQIMRMSTLSHTGLTVSNEEERIDRKCSSCEMKEAREEKRLNISRKPSASSSLETSEEATKKINGVISNGGSALDNDTKDLMESRFGYDFSGVRVHRDERAAESAQSFFFKASLSSRFTLQIATSIRCFISVAKCEVFSS